MPSFETAEGQTEGRFKTHNRQRIAWVDTVVRLLERKAKNMWKAGCSERSLDPEPLVERSRSPSSNSV